MYSSKKQTIETTNTLTVDTEVSIILPENTTAFLATKFEGQEIQKIIGPTNGKKRLWIIRLNKSYFEPYIIEKGGVLGYLIIEPEDSEVKICDASKKNSRQKKPYPDNYLPNDWSKNGKNALKRKSSRLKTGGFLNRYDFAYAGRDVVNQVGKVAPKMITQAPEEINNIVQERIDQVVRSRGAEIERIAPKIIKDLIEEVYKTPFRLLGDLGKKEFQKIKRKLLK